MTSEPFPLSASRGSASFPVPLRLRVLVVDDNRDGADSTADLLAICGADAHARYGGEAGLAAVAELAPDAVVLDLTMPGVDGFAVAEQVRAAGGERPPLLVALTALGDERTKARATAAGFDLHFTKPVAPAELLAALGTHAKRA